MRNRNNIALPVGLLSVCLFLYGCGVRKKTGSERRFTEKDSLSVERIDSIRMGRLWKLDGETHISWEEITLSVPDSNGRQHISSVRTAVVGNRYALTQKDTCSVQSNRSSARSRRLHATEQTVTLPVPVKKKRWWWVVGGFVAIFYIFICRKSRICSCLIPFSLVPILKSSMLTTYLG